MMLNIKWGGRNQPGAGSTLGEEVEQANSFLSRLAITTKFMSKSARIDTITLQCRAWNQLKDLNMCTMLSKRFQKTQESLLKSREQLQELKNELFLEEGNVDVWVCDVQEWAQSGPSSKGSLEDFQSKIEQLCLFIKEHSNRLYKKADTCKQRKKIRRRIRESKKKNVFCTKPVQCCG